MRISLIFPPFSNPTYLPLGISSLFAYLKNILNDEHEVCALDLNIDAWHYFIKEEPDNFNYFFRGESGDFYDEEQYKYNYQTWREIVKIFEKNINYAKLYLEKNILDGDFNEFLTFLVSIILRNDPELLGFSVMFPRQILFTLAIAKRIKEQESGKNIKIVLGGSGMASVYQDDILECCPYIDAVFAGEGERGLKLLIEGRPFEEIPGLIYRKDNFIHFNQKPQTLSLAELPTPDFSQFDLNKYLTPEVVLPYICSRGCLWRRCRFCAHNFSFAGYRCKSSKAAVDEIETLILKYGVNHFYFADQYLDVLYLEKLSDEILKRGIKINFHCMGRPTADYTAERLGKLAKAGCKWISWGVETGSQRLIDIANKGVQVKDIENILKYSHESGINNLLMMIFGLPTSTDNDLYETFDFLENAADFIDSMTESTFLLYEETAFAKSPSKYDLHIVGNQDICTINNKPIRLLKLDHKEIAKDGTLRSPRGAFENEVWQSRKKWIYKPRIFDNLCVEHYLLYASKFSKEQSKLFLM